MMEEDEKMDKTYEQQVEEYKKKLEEIRNRIYDCEDALGIGPEPETEYPYNDPSFEAYNDHLAGVEVEYEELREEERKCREELLELRLSHRKEKWIAAKTQERTLFKKGRMLNESVTDKELQDDILNRRQMADVIANIICDEHTKSPHNIAILGGWGTGKTSFCKFIQQAIKDKNNEKRRYKIVDFNAAEYSSKVLSESSGEHLEQQWSNMLKVMVKEYQKEHPVKSTFCYFFCRLKREISIGQVLLYVLTVLIGLVPAFFVEFSSYDLGLGDKNIELIGNVSSIVATILLLIPVIKSALNTTLSMADKVGDTVKLPNYIDVLGTREKIVSDVEVLLEAWLDKDERLVVFVDDCDRCSKAGIMELFEAMHLFLNLEKLFFVFTIDPRLLNEAVAEYYTSKESNALVDQFLQKYVAETYILDEPNYGDYIDSLSSMIEPDDAEMHCLTSQEYKVVKNALLSENVTPRTIKQLLNSIVQLKNYYMLTPKLAELFSFDAVIGWFLFDYFYTGDSQSIREYFDGDFFDCKLNSIPDLVNSVGNEYKESSIWKCISEYGIYDFKTIEQEMGMLIRHYAFTN